MFVKCLQFSKTGNIVAEVVGTSKIEELSEIKRQMIIYLLNLPKSYTYIHMHIGIVLGL